MERTKIWNGEPLNVSPIALRLIAREQLLECEGRRPVQARMHRTRVAYSCSLRVNEKRSFSLGWHVTNDS